MTVYSIEYTNPGKDVERERPHGTLIDVAAHLPNLYRYRDYRRYLADYYAAQKARRPGFSYRYFSRLSGAKAPNYLQLVVQGKRNLSEAMAVGFAKACKLTDRDTQFFLALVEYGQATEHEARKRAIGKLARFRKRGNIFRLDDSKSQYFAHWYIAAVRELAACDDFQEDPDWIAQTLRPTITRGEAIKAIEVLLDLSLLRRAANRKLRQTNTCITTGAETEAFDVAEYHRQSLHLAEQAMDVFAPQHRDLSCIVLGLQSEDMPKLKQRVSEFRAALIDEFGNAKRVSRVVQVSLQTFPLSHEKQRSADE